MQDFLEITKAEYVDGYAIACVFSTTTPTANPMLILYV